MHMTVCICTRNRGSGVVLTLQSLAASPYPDFDVMIVDQSTTDETEHAVQAAVGKDERFRYLRSSSVGLSVARNIAIGQARGPIIAFTDDDCTVGPDWLAELVKAFRQHPEVGEICGTVRAAPYDPHTGYTPVFDAKPDNTVRSLWYLRRAGGIGANMALRQEALQAVGPFDEILGAGGNFYSGEDIDMTCRMLKAGYSVLDAPEAWIIHDGFRTLDETRVLVRHAYFSLGATYIKYLRMGNLAILPTLLYTWWIQCLSWRKLLLLRRESGLGNFLAYFWGMLVSFRYRIDRRQSVYLPRKRAMRGVISAVNSAARAPD